MRNLLLISLLCFVLVLSACSNEQQQEGSSDKVLKVTSTIAMIHDVVREIGGDRINSVSLMGPGTDPHLYKASQGDIRKLDEADIIFYNGLHLEGKMGDVLERLGKQKTVVAVAEQIPESELLVVDEEGIEVYDPHLWFDVKNWIKVSEVVRDTLIEYDADNANYYEQRAESYLAQLAELDEYAKEQLALIPAESRYLVTAHDAFGYFGRAYGIEVMGLQGISTAAEYGSRDVSELRDFLVENKIKAVFIESSVDKRSIEAVVEGAQRLGHELAIGGELYADAMGQEGTEHGTYIGMFRYNVDTIVEALK